MPSVIKVTGTRATLNATPNTISNATFVRVVNIDTGPVVVTVANNGANVGSIILTTMDGEYIAKYPQDTIVANNNSNVSATPIAFTN